MGKELKVDTEDVIIYRKRWKDHVDKWMKRDGRRYHGIIHGENKRKIRSDQKEDSDTSASVKLPNP
jgi:hypothetical protein